MEATTTARNVSHETALEDDTDPGLSPVQGVLLKAIERLNASRHDDRYRYVNLDKLEMETGYRRSHIGRALKHLVKEGRIVAREDEVNHQVFYSPARPGAPTSLFDVPAPSPKDDGAVKKVHCPVCKELYDPRGLVRHLRSHKNEQAKDAEEEEDDEPEQTSVVTQASSDTTRIEPLLEDATRQGWTIEQLSAHKPFNGGVLKLSFINGAPKVAS